MGVGTRGLIEKQHLLAEGHGREERPRGSHRAELVTMIGTVEMASVMA